MGLFRSKEITKIVHVSSAHPWTDNRIHYRECTSLAEAGYKVTLVAVRSAVGGPRTAVAIRTIPSRSRLKRILLSTSESLAIALRTNAKIFHLHDPELIPAIPVLRLLGKKVIYDAHEDLPVQVKNKPYLNRFATPLMVALAHLLVAASKTSSHVIAATEAIAERYPEAMATVVHNYPPLRAEELDAKNAGERGRAVAYVGGIGSLRGADVMVEAMGRSELPKDWRLELAGKISDRLREELSRNPGWVRTSFHGQVSSPEARDLLLRCRVGLVLFQDTPAHRESLPTKMFEYFAAGLPVIASDFPLWRTIVGDHDCGILVDQTSPGAVASAISRYERDAGLLSRHSENAMRLARERLNWHHEALGLLGVYERLR